MNVDTLNNPESSELQINFGMLQIDIENSATGIYSHEYLFCSPLFYMEYRTNHLLVEIM